MNSIDAYIGDAAERTNLRNHYMGGGDRATAENAVGLSHRHLRERHNHTAKFIKEGTVRKAWIVLAVMTLFVPVLFMGCGSDGSTGALGPIGPQGPEGPQGPAATAEANPESCAVCHNGFAEANGDAHQAIYDAYADNTTFTVTIDSVSSVDTGDGGPYNVTMLFSVKQNGQAYIDANGLPTLDQKRFMAVTYNSATGMFDNAVSFSNPTALGGGQYSVTATGAAYAPELTNAFVYLYIAKGKLVSEGMQLYADVVNVGKEFGDVDTYQSAATVAGCEKCHGRPYMKHGYRGAAVAGLPDFAACKACHFDTRNGGHQAWQVLVDDPLRHATLGTTPLTTEEKDKYAYKASVMNDTHMSHAMEFPYPQSMANCATCHEGKLDITLTDANFTAETCKSCHPVTGSTTYGTATFALNTIWANKLVSWHTVDMTCNAAGCHATGGNGKTFNQIHTGYDKKIYVNTTGTTYTKYSEIFSVTIDDASLSGNTLTIQFNATESPDIAGRAVTDILPSVYVALYGYDSKDFIGRITATQVSAANGSWEYTADLTAWADEIADGKGKRVEIAVLPMLADIVGQIDSHSNGETDDTVYALNAVSRTFDLGTNGFVNFYGDIVKVEGCNNCHDALATTFHSGNRGGNITVCRMCHVTTSGGSHLEMQSRSLDSYVHAIHSFQAFDVGDVNFTDLVETDRYKLHVEHVYPNFTILNCESCHNAGTFNVPDQSKSLAGVFSKADAVTTKDRNIGAVPSYVAGPGSRACGACHRAKMINEDNAGELAAFNSHTKTFGYLGEYTDANQVYTVIDAIMAIF